MTNCHNKTYIRLQELTSGQYHKEEKENKKFLILGTEYSKIQILNSLKVSGTRNSTN